MIRKATHDDIPRICDLGRDFHAYSPWSEVPFDRDSVADFSRRLIDSGVIFLSDDGICGGLLNPLYFNPSAVVAVELFWWAPTEGRALRLAFEEWAQEMGAYAVQFSALGDHKSETVGALFKRAGYRKVETGYLKEFS